MARKQFTCPINLTTAVTASGVFDIGGADKFCIQKQHGSITGTFLVKERIGETVADDTFDYVTNTNISITAAADDVDNECLHFEAGASQYMKIVYTHTSGTGSLHVGVCVMDSSKGG